MTSAASTANAAVPAPGKLEFKDDYTPEEAERVIRNSKGLPVGVKPKMVWTWPKALLWAAIAIVCAIGWAILAVSRGEQISAIWFVVVALCSYAIAYRFYAYYIQIKIMRTDDANATPAERVHDGANFERADRRVLFGQHFAGISGAGPLVGPILAAQMGYLPSVMWIILGVIFAGAVQDMLMLWISAKRRGRSFGQMATDEMGKFGGTILSIFLIVMTAIAMAFLALVAIATWLFAWGGMTYSRLDIDAYNNGAAEDLSDQEIDALSLSEEERIRLRQSRDQGRRIGRVCEIIMLVATIVGLSWLFLGRALTPADADPAAVSLASYFWLSWVLGGIACAIAVIVLNPRP